MYPSHHAVAVIGLGYVGLPLALLADRRGYRVVGIDRDEKKVARLQSRISPIKDVMLEQRLRASTLEVTTHTRAIEEAGIVIVCVPTPVYEDFTPNFEPLSDAAKDVARHLHPGHLVVIESTINPGVCDTIVLPILEEISGLECGKDFFLAHCPERINPGDTRWTVENIPRVIGGFDAEGLSRATHFYRSILSAPIRQMKSLKEAEAVKIVENSFRDINIAFVNELARSFSHLGIDTINVIRGAATKPFAFMPHYPTCGVGGHCIPVDPYYLIQYAKSNGFEHRFLALARHINNEMPKFTARLAEQALRQKRIPVAGTKVAILGLAYKEDIDDPRNSPAFKIIEYLEKRGARVVAYDPYIPALSHAETLEEALSGARVVILATAHREFRNLTASEFMKRGVEILIDGKNCYEPEEYVHAGILYKAIGRHTEEAENSQRHKASGKKRPVAVLP